jgi:hypothetical protein
MWRLFQIGPRLGRDSFSGIRARLSNFVKKNDEEMLIKIDWAKWVDKLRRLVCFNFVRLVV